MTLDDLRSPAGFKWAAAYLLIWAIATAYMATSGGDFVFPMVSLLLFGGILSAVGWWLTRAAVSPPAAVARPRTQSLAFLAYLLLYALVLIGWGLGALKSAIAPGQMQDVAVLAYKLVIHVAVPAAIIIALGGSIRDTWRTGGNGRIWTPLILLSAIFIALLAVVSPSLSALGDAGLVGLAILPWVALSWLWMAMEAGLTEEYLFRAGLQSRLGAWLASPVAAVVITSVLFALAHWPGLFLRGGPGIDGWSTDPVQVAAFTIATLSPLSIMLGILWARTRSLLLVVVIHGAIDALPHAAEMVQVWRV